MVYGVLFFSELLIYPDFDLIPCLSEGVELFFFRCVGRILEGVVDDLLASREEWTAGLGVVADRHHIIDIPVQVDVQGLGGVMGDVDTDLFHDLDGLGLDDGGLGACAEGFIPVSIVVVQ